jgi:transcription antitermination factor NusG
MEAPLAFTQPHEAPGLQVRVNFGVFAGRQATPAEIDQLAAALTPEVGEVTIVAEERHEIDEHVEAAVSQIRIEVDAEHVEAQSPGLEARVCALAESWALACIDDRHEDVVEL